MLAKGVGRDLGNGRFYAPALGRPLQPHSAAVPPTIPQALNRYAATPVGQPGVFAASNNAFNWIPSGATIGYGLVTNLAGELPYISGYTFTGNAVLEVTASRTALTSKKFVDSLGSSVTLGELVSSDRGNRFVSRTITKSLSGNSPAALNQSLDELTQTVQDVLPQKAPWTAQISGAINGKSSMVHYQKLNELDSWKTKVTLGGAGIDFALGAGFQWYEDRNNPFLSSRQVFYRVGVAGVGSAGFGIMGGAIGGATLGWACGPGVVICAPIGAIGGAVIGGLGWSYFQPKIFSATPFRPVRNLRRLN